MREEKRKKRVDKRQLLCLILGIAEALSSAYLSTEYKDVVSFALLILVLLVMPTGILGRPEVEKV